MPCRLGADAAHADDEGCRLRQVDGLTLFGAAVPFTAELVAKVDVQVAGEGEDEGHDVDGNMVVVDAANIRHRDITGDQFGEVEAGLGSGQRTG